MTSLTLSRVLLGAGVLLASCSVYDQDLLSNEEGLGSASTGGEGGGGSGASTGGTASTAGSSSTTAGTSAQGGSGGTGGNDAHEGGTGSEGDGGGDGVGVGGEDGGGTGGGGSGGSAAAGGGSGGNAGGSGSGGVSGASGGMPSGGSNGTGGSGGSAPGPKCSDHPLTAKSTWSASALLASVGNGMESDGLYNPPKHVLDGLLAERWSTGRPQNGTDDKEWLEIDFKQEVSLDVVQVMLLSDLGGNANDYPRGYEIRLSNSSMNTAAPVRASGAGAAGTNLTVSFPTPISGRYLHIKQTGSTTGTEWWTVTEIYVSCTD